MIAESFRTGRSEVYQSRCARRRTVEKGTRTSRNDGMPADIRFPRLFAGPYVIVGRALRLPFHHSGNMDIRKGVYDADGRAAASCSCAPCGREAERVAFARKVAPACPDVSETPARTVDPGLLTDQCDGPGPAEL